MVTYTTFGINMLPNVKWSTSFWYIYFQFVEDHLRRQLDGVKRSFMNNTNKTGTIKHLRNKTFECGFKGGEAIRSVEAETTSYSSTGNRWKIQTLKARSGQKDKKYRPVNDTFILVCWSWKKWFPHKMKIVHIHQIIISNDTNPDWFEYFPTSP